MSREAMRMALEALELLCPMQPHTQAMRDIAITALRAALAEPEQEPVAWMWRCKPFCNWPEWNVSLKRPADSGRDGNTRTEGYEDVPLYTTPPQRKPLSEAMKEQCPYPEANPTLRGAFYDGWMRAEAAHGITGDINE